MQGIGADGEGQRKMFIERIVLTQTANCSVVDVKILMINVSISVSWKPQIPQNEELHRISRLNLAKLNASSAAKLMMQLSSVLQKDKPGVLCCVL